jgi:tellurite resistance protein TerC
VEATDVVFAVDSIPAIFAVTRDPFIVFTSNVFAILGLRALYFVLKTMMDVFRFLKVGLGLVLVFVGAKMCAEKWVHVPAEISLLVVVTLLGISVAASLLRPEKPRGDGEAGQSDEKPAGGDGTEEIGDGKMNPR